MIPKDFLNASFSLINRAQHIIKQREKSIAVALWALLVVAYVFVPRPGLSFPDYFKKLLRVIPNPLRKHFFPMNSIVEHLLSKKFGDWDVKRLLNVFAKTTRAETVLQYATHLFPEPRSRDLYEDYNKDLATIIELLSRESHSEMIKECALKVGLERQQDTPRIVTALCQVPREKINLITDLVKSLISIGGTDKAVLIGVLNLASEPKAIVDAIKELKKLAYFSIDDLCQELANIATDKLDSILAETRRLLPNNGMRKAEVADIVGVLNSAENPKAIVDATLELMIPGLDNAYLNHHVIAKALASVPPERLELVTGQTKRFIENIGGDDIGSVRSRIIESLRIADDPKARVDTAFKIGQINRNIIPLLKEVLLIPFEKLDSVVELASRLLTRPKYSNQERVKVVKSLASIADPAALVELTFRLGNGDLDIHALFLVLNDIPSDRIEGLVAQANRLIVPEESSNRERALIFYGLNSCFSLRESITDATLSLAPAPNRSPVLIALFDIPTIESLNSITTQALRLMRPQFSNEERGHIIRSLRRFPVENLIAEVDEIARQLVAVEALVEEVSHTRVIQLIEDRIDVLNHRLRDRVAIGAGAAAGVVNVHADLRDEKTKDALILLKTKQGSLTSRQTSREVDEFKRYLEGQQDVNVKDLARRALEGPQEVGRDQFPPLLPDDTFTIVGYEMPGREVVARMWLFSKTYAEEGKSHKEIEAERENAKQSMIVALSQSYFQADSSLVCNPGKVQRLCTRVLQGRLPGVDIDGISEHRPVVITDDIISLMFFTEERKAIESKGQLLVEVDKFCAAHPEIDGARVLAIVKEYATQSALDA